LFGGYALLRSDVPDREAETAVKIGAGEVRWLRETFAGQWRREPTAKELHELVATLVNEELMAREARALGLDQHDTVVRRRLAQKLTFLLEDTSRVADPSEDELRRFHAGHAERYHSDSQVSFQHVFFSPSRRPQPEADARVALSELAAERDGHPPEGDPLPMEDTFVDAELRTVSSLFGPDFARAIVALPLGSWNGPVQSGYGYHLVLVSQMRPGEPRRYEDVRHAVLEDWRHQKETEMRDAFLAKLRDKHSVIIEESARALSSPAPDR
jgi:PPIC-type PPIASE domain